MFAALNEKLTDCSAYLSRIAFDMPVSVDKSTLDSLVFRHQCAIPFENLDIHDLGRVISLSTSDLYKKVILEHRGGYCFELNALFYLLLNELGFSPTAHLARVLRGKDFVPPMLHRVNIANIDGEQYFCDVGFGGPTPAYSLRLVEGEVENVRGMEFFFTRQQPYWWTLNRNIEGGVEKILSFCEVPLEPVDFVTPNEYSSKSPDSFFKLSRVINIRTQDGSKSIMNNTFSIVSDGVKEEIPLLSSVDLSATLNEHFNIDIEVTSI